jgi:hypothetical protein
MLGGSTLGTFVAIKLRKVFAGSSFFVLLAVSGLIIPASLAAAELNGKVMNGTTNKPAGGDEVLVLSLSHSESKEIARTNTDSAGRFRFADELTGTYFVRVIHQGVSYDAPAQPTSSIAVQVYDVTDNLDSVRAVMDVQRFEATEQTLDIKQLVTVRNSSDPPRTLHTERSFEIQLPPNAHVKSGLVQIEDEPAIRVKPSLGEQRDTYFFQEPLRPGDTRFAVVYQLPYNGRALIEPKIRNPKERFVIMLPKSMGFEPQTVGVFESMADVSSDNVQGTAPVAPNQTLAFFVSGTGMLEELQGRRSQQTATGQSQILSSELMDLAGRQRSGVKHLQSTRPPENRDAFALIGLTALIAAGTACIYFTRRKTAMPLAIRRDAPTIVRQSRTGQSTRRSKRHTHT